MSHNDVREPLMNKDYSSYENKKVEMRHFHSKVMRGDGLV